ncbi:MAG: hypothetical protein KDK70_36260, partial [Myxococcales bacterium]|nr:hypothetical protein [Myxococcales bacterium]
EIRAALQELLDWRAAEAGPKLWIYDGPRGHRPGESKAKWLRRNGAAPSGPADPDKLPYYLMLVGSPEEIPYSFQYQLDVQYAVGRLWFPTIQEYANYARSVVAAERGGLGRTRTLSFFGARSEGDRATELSTELLVEPLAEVLARKVVDWEVSTFVAEQATCATLRSLLGGERTPALLFTASHGAELPIHDPELQRRHQGALICSDWPGPRAHQGPLARDWYLAGEDLAASADVSGMMLLCFACYGAGTPRRDELRRARPRSPGLEIAPAPFMGALPLSLLGRQSGALAVIGHVGRAWGCSFTDGGSTAKSHITTFESSLLRLLDQQPVGHALDYFNARYAELSTAITEELQDEFKEPDADELVPLWTSNIDARGYVVFGDPAARLCFSKRALEPTDAGPPIETWLRTEPPHEDVPELLPRPAEISEGDWSRTPEAVQRFIDGLLRARR